MCDCSPCEQKLADEFGEAERQKFDAIGAGCDAQQQVGDHRGKDLQADGVIVVAEEFAEIEMLLESAAQEFDLPAALIEGGDLDRLARQVIGIGRTALELFG